MGLIRPATPGFLVTTLATVLLLVVSFSVPWFKSVYFLKAQVEVGNQSGFITFGTLGYCTTINGGDTNCTSAKVGYEFDPNKLLGNNIKFLQIPAVVVKWITWALVLHIVAFALAGVAAVFGLLAHIREFSMTCFSSCISGFAAVVALFAFIFDLVLFFTVKARINKVDGGSASIGNAVWLTLASWMLLFFSGCFYTVGRCCINRRPGGNNKRGRDEESEGLNKANAYGEAMRLDAVKAEADRKARQAAGGGGLPAFPSADERKPLSKYEATYEEDEPTSPYRDNATGVGRVNGPRSPRRQATDVSAQNVSMSAAAATGYTPGQTGTRTIDQYNNAQLTYPPQQTPSRLSNRQQSTSPGPNAYDNSGYQPGGSSYYNQPQGSVPYPTATPAPAGSNANPYGAIAAAAGVTAVGAGAGAYAAQSGHSQSYDQKNSYYNQPPSHLQPQGSTGGYGYGHGQDQTTYHSSYTHPQDQTQYNQQPQAQNSYGSADPYMHIPNPHDEVSPQAYGGSTYPSSTALPQPLSQQPSTYYTPPTGGSNYASNNLQPGAYDNRPNSSGTSYFTYGQDPSGYGQNSAAPGGLHSVQEASSSSGHPPTYESATPYAPGGWPREKS